MRTTCLASTCQELLSGRYVQATTAGDCIFGGQRKWCIAEMEFSREQTKRRKRTLRRQRGETEPGGTGAAPLRVLSSERYGWWAADFCLPVFSGGMVLDAPGWWWWDKGEVALKSPEHPCGSPLVSTPVPGWGGTGAPFSPLSFALMIRYLPATGWAACPPCALREGFSPSSGSTCYCQYACSPSVSGMGSKPPGEQAGEAILLLSSSLMTECRWTSSLSYGRSPASSSNCS